MRLHSHNEVTELRESVYFTIYVWIPMFSSLFWLKTPFSCSQFLGLISWNILRFLKTYTTSSCIRKTCDSSHKSKYYLILSVLRITKWKFRSNRCPKSVTTSDRASSVPQPKGRNLSGPNYEKHCKRGTGFSFIDLQSPCRQNQVEKREISWKTSIS